MNVRHVSPSSEPPEKKQSIEPNKERFQKLTKIDKVSEVDENKTGKKRKRDPEEEEEEVTSSNKNTPIELFTSKGGSLFERKKPSYSSYGKAEPSSVPPPDFISEEDSTSEKLPHAASFWEEAPTDSPSSETTSSKNGDMPEKTPAAPPQKDSKKRKKPYFWEDPFLPSSEKKPSTDPKKGAPTASNKASSLEEKKGEASPLTKKKKKERKTSSQKEVFPPSSELKQKKPPLKKEPVQEILSESVKTSPEKKPTSPTSQQDSSWDQSQVKEEKKTKEIKQKDDLFAPLLIWHHSQQDLPAKHKKEEEHTKEVSGETSSQQVKIPSEIAEQGIQASQTCLPSYMSPQVQSLFAQMVGSLMVMQQKGISQTTVVLNSPAFQSSIFHGATITFTRYSTAPDSFNIKLKTESSQALKLFSENLDTLQGAFIKGNFSFRVGRLEAEAIYETNRPLFHRKKGVGDKDTDTGHLR